MNEPELAHPLLTLGRLTAIECALRVLINSADRPALLCAEIRDAAAPLIAFLKDKEDLSSEVMAMGIEEGIELITETT